MANAHLLLGMVLVSSATGSSGLRGCGHGGPGGGNGHGGAAGSAGHAGQAGSGVAGDSGGAAGSEPLPTAGEDNGGGSGAAAGGSFTAGTHAEAGEASGGKAGEASGGEAGGSSEPVDVLPQTNVRWLGACAPVALSDDAKTVLALEGVWTEASGWLPLPDLPGGDTYNQPRALSGNGRVVYGNSGSSLGDEIYRFDVESQTIQGLGERYNSWLGEVPTRVPESVRSIDTNEDGNMLVGYYDDSEFFRWTPNGGFVDVSGGINTNLEPSSVVLSSNGATAVFGNHIWPMIISSLEVSLATDQFAGAVLFPVAVSGDGRWYSIAGTHAPGPTDLAPHCVFGDGCENAHLAILDFDYSGQAGVGRQYWGAGREPVASFYWSSPDQVRYLHEALFDHRAFVDTETLSRVAINADGRRVLGTATRHYTDGSNHQECFVAELLTPVDDPDGDRLVESTVGASLSAGSRNTCVRDGDGGARCWGAGVGRLADVSESAAWSAVPIAVLAGARQIAPGEGHGCAVFEDNTVRCWGNNGSGQLGDGTFESRATPVAVTGLDDATQVATAGNASCALRQGGGVVCWGSNQLGVVGQEYLLVLASALPMPIAGLPPARSVAVARWGACAVLLDGAVACWGTSYSLDDFNAPRGLDGLQDISQFVMSGNESWCALSAEGAHVTCDLPPCSRCERSQPYCAPEFVERETLLFSGTVASISVGEGHACGLLANGTVECAGLGTSGQLGARGGVCRDSPQLVPGLTQGVQIASGSHHSCALLQSGQVRCWGLDDVGQLGNGFVYTNSRNVAELPSGIARPGYVRRSAD